MWDEAATNGHYKYGIYANIDISHKLTDHKVAFIDFRCNNNNTFFLKEYYCRFIY